MKHSGTKLLESQRLLLRQFNLSDSFSFFKNCGKDEKASLFLSWNPHQNAYESEEYLKSVIEQYEDPKFYNWAIELKETGEVIGSIGVNHPEDKNKSCQIGYYVGSDFWNKGIITEALKTVIDYLFEEVELNRVAARHDIENGASGRVMAKANMTFEGILRESKLKGNKFCSLAIYSILKSEWENNKLL